jgi:hypothetical protein
MLRWRKRLTPGPLAPIAWRCRAPVPNSALRSSHIHLDEHRRRRSRQSPIEDHLHPAIALVALAEVLVEPRSVTPHDDEPVRQFATGKHLLDDLIGPREHGWRNRRAQRLRGLEIDHELELRRLLDRKISRVRPLSGSCLHRRRRGDGDLHDPGCSCGPPAHVLHDHGGQGPRGAPSGGDQHEGRRTAWTHRAPPRPGYICSEGVPPPMGEDQRPRVRTAPALIRWPSARMLLMTLHPAMAALRNDTPSRGPRCRASFGVSSLPRGTYAFRCRSTRPGGCRAASVVQTGTHAECMAILTT